MLLTLAVASLLAGAEPSASRWEYWEQIDPITDQLRAGATLVGDAGRVVIKCDKPGPASMYLQLTTRDVLYLGSDVERPGLWRVDAGAPQRTDFRYTNDGAFIFEATRAGFMASKWGAAKRLVLRLWGYDQRQLDLVIVGDGDPAPLKRAFATCGQTWVDY